MSANIEAILENKAAQPMHDGLELSYDIVFVINANSRGWILDKICRIVEKYSHLNCYFLYSERNDHLTSALPKARAYFFAHFAIAFWTLLKYPHAFGGSIYTYFTHFDQNKGVSQDELISFMNICDRVFVMNSSHERALVSLGADPDRVMTVLGGADPDVFTGHPRGGGVVGFVGAYYPRKQPEKMIALMRAMPDVNFLLLAPGPDDVENPGLLWRNWSQFAALRALPNLRYVEAPYEDYPRYFAEMDVYVSLSSQEGGPIPIIEAMMSNRLVVASDTGFAADVLTDDLARYIVGIDASVEEIASRVRTALADTETDTRERVKALSWQSVGETILDAMRPTMAFDRLDPVLDPGETVVLRANSEHLRFLTGKWDYLDDRVVPLDQTAGIDLNLRDPVPGRYRLGLGLALPKQFMQQPDDDASWKVEVVLNGRPVFKGGLTPSGRADVETWVELSPEDVGTRLRLGVTIGAPDGEARAHAAIMGTQAPGLTELRFDAAGSPDQTASGVLLDDRWHQHETNGIWSNGPVASVATFLTARSDAWQLRPVIRGRAFGVSEPDGGELTVETFCGGTLTTDTFSLASDDETDLVLTPVAVPAGYAGPVIVTLRRRRSFVPKELDPALGDGRDLGFFLTEISFT